MTSFPVIPVWQQQMAGVYSFLFIHKRQDGDLIRLFPFLGSRLKKVVFLYNILPNSFVSDTSDFEKKNRIVKG
jgi:hypothetical protein